MTEISKWLFRRMSAHSFNIMNVARGLWKVKIITKITNSLQVLRNLCSWNSCNLICLMNLHKSTLRNEQLGRGCGGLNTASLLSGANFFTCICLGERFRVYVFPWEIIRYYSLTTLAIGGCHTYTSDLRVWNWATSVVVGHHGSASVTWFREGPRGLRMPGVCVSGSLWLCADLCT